MLREEFFHQPADFDIVTAQPGHILDKHSRSMALFQLGHHIIEAGAIHCNPRNAVIGKDQKVLVSHILCGFRQELFLIPYTVTLALQIIVTGEAEIQKRGIIA